MPSGSSRLFQLRLAALRSADFTCDGDARRYGLLARLAPIWLMIPVLSAMAGRICRHMARTMPEKMTSSRRASVRSTAPATGSRQVAGA